MSNSITVGNYWGRGDHRKRILEIIKLTNNWILLKTENGKSSQDYKVKVIFSLSPQRSQTPKHAHFLIDLYGKLCADSLKGKTIFEHIISMWAGEDVSNIILKNQSNYTKMPGYPLEYILYALHWILRCEDINFTTRSENKQKIIDSICSEAGITLLEDRLGSQLAISMMADLINGTHPVEAMRNANIKVVPY